MSGWIRKRSDRPSPWRAGYRGPDGRERTRSFRRKIDAELWLRSELGKLDRVEWVDPSAGTVTLATWAEKWLAGRHGLKPLTVAGYASVLRSRVLPTFGDYQLRRITPAEIREWQSGIIVEGLSSARARAARQVLHAVLEQAVADGLLARNPVDRVKAPTVRPRRQRFLTAGQLGALADAAERRQEDAGALIRLLGWSGLRWGEAVALRASCVDVARRRVRVREAAAEVGGRLTWGPPKTHEARTVVVPRFVLDPLAGRLARLSGDSLAFTAPHGGPLRASNFRRDVWRTAVAASGAPADLMVHDLRDTAASLMISSGASIKAVQRALGHASAAMTLDVYGGLFEEDLEALADRMEARFGPGAAQERPKLADVARLPRSQG